MSAPVPRRRSAAKRWVLLGLFASLAGMGRPVAATEAEAAAKAAVLFNLLGYVQWPADALPSPGDDAAVLCVPAQSPLLPALRPLVGRLVGPSLPFDLQEIGPLPPARRCLALLIDGSPRMSVVRRHCLMQPVLVVADEAAPADDTPAARLVDQQGRIGFELDLTSARHSRLQLSARLLRLARAIKE